MIKTAAVRRVKKEEEKAKLSLPRYRLDENTKIRLA